MHFPVYNDYFQTGPLYQLHLVCRGSQPSSDRASPHCQQELPGVSSEAQDMEEMGVPP